MAVALDGNNVGGINDGHWAAGTLGYAGANGRYAKWDTLTHGVNAMCALLTGYLKRGFSTPTAIANRWAPHSDGNDTDAYAKAIASGMHVALTTPISLAEAMQLTLVMAKIENSAFPAKWAAEQKRVAAHK